MDFINAGLDPLDDIPGIASPQHEDDSADDLAIPVQNRRPMSDGMVDHDLRHVGDIDRSSTGFLDHDTFDILKRADQPDPADNVLLSMFFQNISAGVGIIS